MWDSNLLHRFHKIIDKYLKLYNVLYKPARPSGQGTQTLSKSFAFCEFESHCRQKFSWHKNPFIFSSYAINPIILLEYSSQALCGCYAIGFVELLLITLGLFKPQKQAFLLQKYELEWQIDMSSRLSRLYFSN